MAKATAAVIVGARQPILRGATPREKAALTRVLDTWQLRGVEIEQKLSAYFPAHVAALWNDYRDLVDTTFADWQLAEELGYEWWSAARTGPHGPQAIQPLGIHGHDPEGAEFDLGLSSPLIGKYAGVFKSVVLDASSEVPATSIPIGRSGLLRIRVRTRSYSDVEAALLDIERRLAREVLAARLRGFSTTFRDFLHDLFP
jgi:hypothetical protein